MVCQNPNSIANISFYFPRSLETHQRQASGEMQGAMDLAFQPQAFDPILHFGFKKTPADGEESVLKDEAVPQKQSGKGAVTQIAREGSAQVVQ